MPLPLATSPPAFCHRDALFAERAVLWLVGLDVEVQQCGARDVAEIDFAAAAVDEHADGDGDAAVCLDDVDDFLDGAAGRDDVFDNQAALKNGASHLVIGRPIRAAEDPKAAAEAILKEMETVQ